MFPLFKRILWVVKEICEPINYIFIAPRCSLLIVFIICCNFLLSPSCKKVLEKLIFGLIGFIWHLI